MLFPMKVRVRSLLVAGVSALALLALSGCGIFGSSDSPPSAPDQLSLSASQDGVDLSWSGGSDADGYNVYRSQSSIPEDLSNASPVNSSPVQESSYMDDGAEKANAYFYRVTAVNDEGESDPSTEQQVQMPYPEPPEQP